MRNESALAVLSYHSWEITPATLDRDIVDLRRSGWAFVGTDEAMEYVSGRSRNRARLVLITTDDGHPEDARFLDVLRATATPAVSFINLARMDPVRLQWYASHAVDPLLAIEDHGMWHRRAFVSSQLYDFVAPATPMGGLEYLQLPVGAPLFMSGGELTSRRFTPADSAVELCVRRAAQSTEVVGGAVWREQLERALLERGLARRVRGKLYVAGRFESVGEYRNRVAGYLAEGRSLFERVMGRAPRLYSHTWWQGSPFVDDCLRRAGYTGSFSGVAFVQPPDGRRFAIPRLPIDEATARPLRPEQFPRRRRWRSPIPALKAALRERMGIR